MELAAAEMRAPSASMEDYAKTIYSLTREHAGSAASTNELAARLGVTTGAVSTMVKRLDAAGLAEHVPYKGVRLTTDGRRIAMRVLRRHRLLELFLAESLDMPWADVHQHAETLEHAASDELIEIIAKALGDPEFDPHGDPIPDRDGGIAEPDLARLATLEPGETATLVRVSDSDPAMLRYLTERGIGIGSTIAVRGREPFGGPFEIEADGRAIAIGEPLACAMQVRRV